MPRRRRRLAAMKAAAKTILWILITPVWWLMIPLTLAGLWLNDKRQGF